MPQLAIIGGTGLTSLNGLEITKREVVHTPYGEPSGPLTYGTLCGKEVVFLARHGYGHTIPPHKINYCANVWALHSTGVKKVVAIAAVGGITEEMTPGKIVIPDQIIDYTWGRQHTFFEDALTHVTHIDFTDPYSAELREILLQGCRAAKIEHVDSGAYGATQGPRLESTAEITRMERDGCCVVGMTGMPEAALARELELSYATCAVVVNKAAGRGEGPITMDQIEQTIKTGMERVRLLLENIVPLV